MKTTLIALALVLTGVAPVGAQGQTGDSRQGQAGAQPPSQAGPQGPAQTAAPPQGQTASPPPGQTAAPPQSQTRPSLQGQIEEIRDSELLVRGTDGRLHFVDTTGMPSAELATLNPGDTVVLSTKGDDPRGPIGHHVTRRTPGPKR